MQALGNDFMVIYHDNPRFSAKNLPISRWSDRHFGIGFDQLLIISPSKHSEFDFNYQIFNPNGDEVGQCGNGARCAAIYINEYIRPEQKKIRLKTLTTQMEVEVVAPNLVKLNLPPPVFIPQKIPLTGFELADEYSLNLKNGNEIKIHAVQVGNPHAIINIENAIEHQQMNIIPLGQEIEEHPAFPERCNVNFMHIQGPKDIALRVWERGCSETLACGSGALATAAIARQFYQLENPINVHLPGGTLIINWPDLLGPIEQIGPALEVYQGKINAF